MLIPAPLLSQWAGVFKASRAAKMTCLLQLRELLSDATDNPPKHAQMLREAAVAMGYSYQTMRHLVADLREYPDAYLADLISSGVTFEQIRSMNELESMGMLNTTPAQLLTEAHELGNAEGAVMSCDELFVHAVGHNKQDSVAYRLNKWIYRAPFVVNLTTERRAEFAAAVKALVEEYA